MVGVPGFNPPELQNKITYLIFNYISPHYVIESPQNCKKAISVQMGKLTLREINSPKISQLGSGKTTGTVPVWLTLKLCS